ncbi:MAG: helix-turn-helix domain-containing protein [Promethearchaeota archaeon]
MEGFDLTDIEEKILRILIIKNKPLSVNDILQSDMVKITRYYVYDILKKLVSKGLTIEFQKRPKKFLTNMEILKKYQEKIELERRQTLEKLKSDNINDVFDALELNDLQIEIYTLLMRRPMTLPELCNALTLKFKNKNHRSSKNAPSTPPIPSSPSDSLASSTPSSASTSTSDIDSSKNKHQRTSRRKYTNKNLQKLINRNLKIMLDINIITAERRTPLKKIKYHAKPIHTIRSEKTQMLQRNLNIWRKKIDTFIQNIDLLVRENILDYPLRQLLSPLNKEEIKQIIDSLPDFVKDRYKNAIKSISLYYLNQD